MDCQSECSSTLDSDCLDITDSADDDFDDPLGVLSEKRKKAEKKKAKEKKVSRLCFCYICGHRYTAASLPFHEKQCLAKWNLVNSKLPSYLKKSHPKKPVFSINEYYTRDEIIDIQWKSAMKNRFECPHCHRCFSLFTIERHAEICRNVQKQSPYVKSEEIKKLENRRNLFFKYSLVPDTNENTAMFPESVIAAKMHLKVKRSNDRRSTLVRLNKSNEYLKIFLEDEVTMRSPSIKKVRKKTKKITFKTKKFNNLNHNCDDQVEQQPKS